MGEGVLELLPSRGLDQSILLAVMVGMLSLAIFVEAYGWVFVGLVVPGYLASVMVVNPAAAAAVVFEALVTYVIVRALSDTLSRSGAWSPFFGRERFFLIVLVSVVVRQNSEIWLLDAIAAPIDDFAGTNLVGTRQLSSIGLVLVPLVANMFWKLDVRRGLVQVGVPTVITYAALQLVLLRYTNLSFAALELTYENVALDFLGSAKAYIILLTGAYLSARSNLRYGWDYNGILVPSLLALTWFNPLTVGVTLIEALLLYFAARGAVKLPGLRTANLEGPRKVVLVFTIGFLIKYAGGWALGDRLPGLQITDFFGFGYVLTSLLAVKMLQKNKIGRVLLPTLQMSLVAFAVGSLVGYGLEQVAPQRAGPRVAFDEAASPTRTLVRTPLGVALAGAVRARPLASLELREGRNGAVLGEYARLWRGIDRWIGRIEGAGAEQRVRERAGRLGLALVPVEAPVAGRAAFALLDAEERLRHQTGWDTALLVPGAPGPVLEVPRPLSEPLTPEAAAVLCEALECRGLIVAGLDRDDDGRTIADGVGHPRSTLRVALRQVRSAPIIAVRSAVEMDSGAVALHLRHTIPPGVDLASLWPPGDLELVWSRPPDAPASWGDASSVVLRAHPAALRRLVETRYGQPLRRVAGESVEQWVAGFVGTRGPGAGVAPSETELRFIETRLVPAVVRGTRGALELGNRLAGLIDHEIVELRDCEGPGLPCLSLVERRRASQLRWALLVVRDRGEGVEPVAFEVPRPRIEAGSSALAAALWRAERARYLLVDHGADPATDRPNPASIGAVSTAFQAIHQAVHRGLAERRGGFIGQIRGLADERGIADDLVLSVGPPVLQERQKPGRAQAMLGDGGPLGFLTDRTRWADGAAELVAVTGQGQPQVAFTRSAGDTDIAVMWFSRRVRERYATLAHESAREVFARLGMTPLPEPPRQWLGAQRPTRPAPGESVASLVDRAEAFAVTRNVHALSLLTRAAQDAGVATFAGIDPEGGRAYVALKAPTERVVVYARGDAATCDAVSTVAAAMMRRCRRLIVVAQDPAPEVHP